MGKRILVVDDDPRILEMVEMVLRRAGHKVFTARDGEEGFRVALEISPDLVIADVMMPKMSGWALVRSMRSNPRMSMIPVIFLTALNSAEDRILGYRLGADDFLPKPFRFDELQVRVERVLRSADRMRERYSSSPGFSSSTLAGDLSHLGLSATLTLLSMEHQSGVLLVRGPATGRIFLRDGRVVAAFLEDPEKGSLQGAEAVYEMLTWSRGSFQFGAAEVDMEDTVGMSTTHLLLEGARRMDEEERDGGDVEASPTTRE